MNSPKVINFIPFNHFKLGEYFGITRMLLLFILCHNLFLTHTYIQTIMRYVQVLTIKTVNWKKKIHPQHITYIY